MADTFRIIPYVVRSAGTDVPPEEVQAAVNSLAQQTTIALNSVASDPTGPAGGDLSGTYPNPTVTTLHVTGGTESGVAVTGNTINNSPIGGTTPSTGAFTTATAGSLFASGGAVPAVTATGTQIYNSPNPTVQFIDSIRSANNKNAFVTWGSTVLAFGFANDAFTGFTNALAITGGQTSGISGITSTSGTGAWAHTGGFSATGGINSTNIGATTPGTGAFTTLTSTGGALNGTVGATTPNTGAFTTLSATSTVSGAGFTTFFASPPPIGSTAANTGAFTTLSASSTVSGTGFVNRFASPGPIGNTAASTGAFTTLSSTGAFTPSSTNGIVGTTTNDNANAGSIGEFASNTTSGTSLTNNTPANATSVSLTAGDWDVAGTAQFSAGAGATATQIIAGVSNTTGAFNGLGSFTTLSLTFTAANSDTISSPVTRFSLSTTTTIFLVVQSTFAGGTMTANSFIRARRVR